jgi:hypothetical protein
VVEAQPFQTTTATAPPPAGPTVSVTGAGGRTEPPAEPLAVAQAAPLPPRRVSFPTSGNAADVVPIGVLPSGALQLPDDPASVGWWVSGALPGARKGTLVLAGHMDGLRQDGAMAALLRLREGDAITVEDNRGTTYEYETVARRSSPWQNLDPGLFTAQGDHRLVLITCGGTYDPALGRYTDNIVVEAIPTATR